MFDFLIFAHCSAKSFPHHFKQYIQCLREYPLKVWKQVLLGWAPTVDTRQNCDNDNYLRGKPTMFTQKGRGHRTTTFPMKKA
jgi:hypothetical protein